MERDEILNRIDEQEQWAASAFARVQETDLFPEPASGDAQFLVAVRERIEKGRGKATYRPEFIPFRRVAWVASVCVILLVAVIAGGRFAQRFDFTGSDQIAQSQSDDFAQPMTTAEEPDSDLANLADAPTDNIVDSLANENIDPVELAQYLDVPDYVQEDVADTTDDLPLTDQLLTLDTGTLEEVLNDLEDTKFF